MSTVPLPVTIRDNAELSRYEASVAEELAAFTEYRLRDATITFVYTEVAQPFLGQGMGSRLAAGTLDDVRRRGLSVVPECHFIRKYMRKHPETIDLVPVEVREHYEM